MIRTYKFRMYPTPAQERRLHTALSRAWRIWNDAAHEYKEHADAGEWLTKYDQRTLWSGYRNAYDELQVLPAKTVEHLIFRLHGSWKSYFQLRKKGYDTARPPGQTPRHKYTVLEYTPGSGCKFMPEAPGVGRLKLHYVGQMRVHQHRAIPNDWKLKKVTVRVDPLGKWYVSLALESADVDVLPAIGPAVGIDMGLVKLITLSDGNYYPHPRWYYQAQSLRSTLSQKIDCQRRAANPQNYNENGTVKEGACIWRKSTRQRHVERDHRKLEAKVTRQRDYFWHMVTAALVKQYGVIVLEDLNLKFMQQNGKLAQYVYDAGLAKFRNLLDQKAAEAGVTVVYVNPAYTSQICHECGAIAKENRPDQATFKCVACGHEDHADINAAKNILTLGLAMLAGESIVYEELANAS